MATQPLPEAQILQMAKQLEDVMNQKRNGRMMEKLQLRRKSVFQALKANGQAAPATIINFNPLPLKVAGGLERYTVPKAGNQPDDMTIKVRFSKTQFVGSYLTIREALLYPFATDVKKPEAADDGDALGVYDIAVCKPIESALHIWDDYNSPRSGNMGGVIIFQGDKHVFTKAMQALANPSKDKDNVPTLLVPKYIILEDRTREYFVEEKPLSEVLRQAFEAQNVYFEERMQNAQRMYDDPDERKNITNNDRLWAQYGIDMGWRQTTPPWLNAKEDPQDTCNGCGAQKTRSDAMFCAGCNRPFDPLAAYLKGENVPESYLIALPEPQLGEFLKERKRRKALLE